MPFLIKDEDIVHSNNESEDMTVEEVSIFERQKRIKELEELAKRKYIDSVDWNYIIQYLNDADIEEYYNLMKEEGGL